MSLPHDTDPPPPAPTTAPELPEEPIAAGKAALHVAGAFVDILAAVSRALAVCDAVARQLDAGTK